MRRNNFILADRQRNSKTHSAPNPVKLHLDTASGFNAVTGHGTGFVAVNGEKISSPLILLPDRLISPWRIGSPSVSALSLCMADFAELLELKPELVVFGSGTTFRFPDRSLLAAFSQARIGFEVMDTPAACRTYNVLSSEGRQIAAALLVGDTDT